MKIKKTFFLFALLTLIFSSPDGVYAKSTCETIYRINDNYYTETIIQDTLPENLAMSNISSLRNAGKTITKTKTTKTCAKDGTVLWSVSI